MFSAFPRITDALRRHTRSSVLVCSLAAALFCVVPLAHATLNNGEPAVDILGEFNSPSVDTTADYVKGCPNDGASPLGFDLSGNADIANNAGGVVDSTYNRLFVADGANTPGLVFPPPTGNLLASKTPAYVLGQPDFVTCASNNTGGNPTAATMYAPSGLDF